MEILAQRGDEVFLVKQGSKYYLVNTDTMQKERIESPDVLYRQGYCVDPEPTKEQKIIIESLFDLF